MYTLYIAGSEAFFLWLLSLLS